MISADPAKLQAPKRARSVSVAMCTYDSERFLAPQLESFRRQSRTPDELVVSDDGSSDGTLRMLEAFARSAPFSVRLHRNPSRLGTARNFERAISLSHGDVVFLSDADDVWYPDKIARLMAIFEGDPSVGAAFCDAEIVDENLQPLGHRAWQRYLFPRRQQRRVARGSALRVLLRHNVVGGNTLAFRSSFRDLVLPIPPGWVHDRWIPLLIAAVSRIVAVPTPLLHYRQHPGQEIGAATRSMKQIAEGARATVAADYEALADHYEEAAARLAAADHALPPDTEVLKRLRAKVEHTRARGSIHEGRAGLAVLLRELVRLNYHRYSRGWRSVVVDVLA